MNRFPSDGCVAVKDCNLQIADDRVPAIGEIGFAGTSAADSISGTVGGLSAQRVRVGAGAEWRPSQVANIAWEDLVFDDGATILLSPDANGMVPSIAVQGKAMLGDTLVYRLERNGNRLKTGSGTLISAVGGVVGDPEFVRGDATPKGLSFSVENAEALLFKYMPPGILLLVK